MTLFNGNTFPVADEELAHENGPEDALLQQHLMAQHRYLGDQRGNRHGFSPKRANNSLVSHLGDKTFASVNRTCPWQRLVWVYPDRSGLTVKLLGRVNSEAPTAIGAKMFVSLEIEGFGTQNYTLDETANYTTHTLEFLIDEPPSSPILVGLRLWVKSQALENQAYTSADSSLTTALSSTVLSLLNAFARYVQGLFVHS